jgi:hypothetical protein
VNLPAHAGEDALALDELPPEAEAEACIAIFADVHAEGIAAVMAGIPSGADPWQPRGFDQGRDQRRPRSGLASTDRGGKG